MTASEVKERLNALVDEDTRIRSKYPPNVGPDEYSKADQARLNQMYVERQKLELSPARAAAVREQYKKDALATARRISREEAYMSSPMGMWASAMGIEPQSPKRSRRKKRS